MLYSLKCKRCGAIADGVYGEEEADTNSCEINPRGNTIEWSWTENSTIDCLSCPHEDFDITGSEFEDIYD